MHRRLLLLIPLAIVGYCGVGSWNCVGRDLLLERPDGAPKRATTLVAGPPAKNIFVMPDGSLLRLTLDGRLVVGRNTLRVGSLRDVAYAAERVATLDEQGRIAVYSVPSLELLAQVKVDAPKDEYSAPFAVALSESGRIVATGDGKSDVHRWGAETGRALGVEPTYMRRVIRLFFSKETLYAFGDPPHKVEDQQMLEWPVQGWANRSLVEGGNLEIGPGGRYWVYSTGDVVGPRWKIHPEYPGSMAMASADGRLLALSMGSNWIAGSMCRTAVVDAATGENVVWMRHPAWRMNALAWWKDRLILGGIEGYLGVFDPKIGNREWSLTGHDSEVVSVKVFGNRLITLDALGSVRSLDLTTLR